jgi:FtsZ-binding cell division protein ZapB
MRKIIILIILSITISSCNQEKNDELELVVFQLEEELKEKIITIDNQKKKIKSLRDELEVKNEAIKQYSDSEIIEIVKKEREYYSPNVKRNNFVIRKINTNIYDVRFDLISTGSYGREESKPTVYRIQFLTNDKYTLKQQKKE